MFRNYFRSLLVTFGILAVTQPVAPDRSNVNTKGNMAYSVLIFGYTHVNRKLCIRYGYFGYGLHKSCESANNFP